VQESDGIAFEEKVLEVVPYWTSLVHDLHRVGRIVQEDVVKGGRGLPRFLGRAILDVVEQSVEYAKERFWPYHWSSIRVRRVGTTHLVTEHHKRLVGKEDDVLNGEIKGRNRSRLIMGTFWHTKGVNGSIKCLTNLQMNVRSQKVLMMRVRR
jgi:hypothetical protein